jgi:hypothetical protein
MSNNPMNDLVVNTFVSVLDSTDLTDNELLHDILYCEDPDKQSVHDADTELYLRQASVDDIINDPRFQNALRDLVGDAREELLLLLRH